MSVLTHGSQRCTADDDDDDGVSTGVSTLSAIDDIDIVVVTDDDDDDGDGITDVISDGDRRCDADGISRSSR